MRRSRSPFSVTRSVPLKNTCPDVTGWSGTGCHFLAGQKLDLLGDAVPRLDSSASCRRGPAMVAIDDPAADLNLAPRRRRAAGGSAPGRPAHGGAAKLMQKF